METIKRCKNCGKEWTFCKCELQPWEGDTEVPDGCAFAVAEEQQPMPKKMRHGYEVWTCQWCDHQFMVRDNDAIHKNPQCPKCQGEVLARWVSSPDGTVAVYDEDEL